MFDFNTAELKRLWKKAFNFHALNSRKFVNLFSLTNRVYLNGRRTRRKLIQNRIN